MHTHPHKTQRLKSQHLTDQAFQDQSNTLSGFQINDNRPVAVAQRKLQQVVSNSDHVKHTAQLQAMAENYNVQFDHPIQHKGNTIGPSPKVIQRQLQIDTTDPHYLETVTEHLRELVGDTGKIIVDRETGIVSFLGKRKGSKKVIPTPGHRLIKSLVDHRHTTIIREARGANALSSEPVLPDNTIFGKGLDWVKGFQYMRRKGFLTHQARAFVNGATPGVGVGTIVHYDANLSDEERMGDVRLPNGKTQRESSPQSISLGHELIHSDHFHRGVAAYDRRGMPILSSRQHTFSQFSRGETTNLEEMNTVGLPPLPPDHDFHDHITRLNLHGTQTYQSELSERDHQAKTITEQDLRKQMGLLPRAGYER